MRFLLLAAFAGSVMTSCEPGAGDEKGNSTVDMAVVKTILKRSNNKSLNTKTAV